MSTLLDELAGLPTADAYDNLPESIKCLYTREQWLWFSDREKSDLVTRECEPDSFEE